MRNWRSLALVGIVLACGCSQFADDTTTSDLQVIKEQGKIVMLCVPHQENEFIHTNLEIGPMRDVGTVEHFKGIDVEIMATIAEKLGVALEIKPALAEDGFPSYGALIPALLAGQGDVIASSFSITAERAKKVDYSDPYYEIEPVVIVRSGEGIESVDDLAGRIAAVVANSSQEERLRALGFTDDRLRFVEFMLLNYQAVSDAEADLTLVDSTSARRLVEGFPNLEVAFALEGQESYGYAARPGSDLIPVVNEVFADLKTSGRLDQIIAAHVGTGANESGAAE
jgi:polar amino acid transport system substrate-binding protein